MNYYTLRIIITIISALLGCLVLYKFHKSALKKYFFLVIMVFIIITGMLWSVPFEKSYIRFQDVNSAFKYNYPLAKIIKTYLNEQYAYILYTNNGKYNVIHYTKDHGKWSIENSIYTNQNKISIFNNCSVILNTITEKNITLVLVVSYDAITENIVVSDSNQTNFDAIEFSITGELKTNVKIGELNEKVNKDYYIVINGKKYYPMR